MTMSAGTYAIPGTLIARHCWGITGNIVTASRGDRTAAAADLLTNIHLHNSIIRRWTAMGSVMQRSRRPLPVGPDVPAGTDPTDIYHYGVNGYGQRHRCADHDGRKNT